MRRTSGINTGTVSPTLASAASYRKASTRGQLPSISESSAPHEFPLVSEFMVKDFREVLGKIKSAEDIVKVCRKYYETTAEEDIADPNKKGECDWNRSNLLQYLLKNHTDYPFFNINNYQTIIDRVMGKIQIEEGKNFRGHVENGLRPCHDAFLITCINQDAKETFFPHERADRKAREAMVNIHSLENILSACKDYDKINNGKDFQKNQNNLNWFVYDIFSSLLESCNENPDKYDFFNKDNYKSVVQTTMKEIINLHHEKLDESIMRVTEEERQKAIKEQFQEVKGSVRTIERKIIEKANKVFNPQIETQEEQEVRQMLSNFVIPPAAVERSGASSTGEASAAAVADDSVPSTSANRGRSRRGSSTGASNPLFQGRSDGAKENSAK